MQDAFQGGENNDCRQPDLKHFPESARPNLGIDIALFFSNPGSTFALDAKNRLFVGREAAMLSEMLHQIILLLPALTEPDVKRLWVSYGNSRDMETAEMKVDALGSATLEEGRSQSKDILTVDAWAVESVSNRRTDSK
jgi:hypothetical protein